MSQLAATVHLTGHIYDSAHEHPHHHEAGPFAAHIDDHSASESHGPDDVALECAIYHTYVGQSGLVPYHCIVELGQLTSLNQSSSYEPIVIGQKTDNHLIRGPPSIS